METDWQTRSTTTVLHTKLVTLRACQNDHKVPVVYRAVILIVGISAIVMLPYLEGRVFSGLSETSDVVREKKPDLPPSDYETGRKIFMV